jgi:hypothetical protein
MTAQQTAHIIGLPEGATRMEMTCVEHGKGLFKRYTLNQGAATWPPEAAVVEKPLLKSLS